MRGFSNHMPVYRDQGGSFTILRAIPEGETDALEVGSIEGCPINRGRGNPQLRRYKPPFYL